MHGYGEHIGRYDHVGSALANAGLSVYGCDLRGHGRSAGPRGHIQHFSQYLDDAEALVSRARSSGLPVFVLGHSNGGLIATHHVFEHPVGVAGIVLSSPFFGLKLAVPAIKIAAGRIASRVYPQLKLPSGLHGADVSRDPVVQRDYDNDPLNNKHATARWFTETTAAQQSAYDRAPALTVPCLVLHGGADRIADPARTEAVAARFGSRDKTVAVLPGQFHEIFNEPAADRAATLVRVTEWLTAHLD